ncbi:zf-TFIIB domain-containing protein [Xanthomonas sp. XNM01]|uniref:TFIIB-type zinc ribbon-containing protein n=1 Tax=Xanthomonas sp. XNM01 TaxID=2769289 RepID=UPI00177D8F88|nr:zf-TFIIB domain-containing protein [Xanthomonas sp. XNM01]MBD9369898.1 zf-TFIIB domain-containing protein [Xanthomonas sp. XNM01]
MHCPACKTVTLAMTERQGIEIDYCPQCRGIWLDRGELDRLIERAEADLQPSAPQPPPPPQPHAHQAYPPQPAHRDGYRDEYRERGKHGYQDGYGYGHKRKKKSLLNELFDF